MTMTPERFRDLVDEATATPAGGPPSREPTWPRGAARLRRRRAGAAARASVAATVVALALGTTLTGGPRADSPSGRVEDPHEPPVLSDVVDAAFPTPGRAALRNIRVQTFLRSWGVTTCGGKGAPLDSTADRFEQDTLPSLELIREKGFTEPGLESFKGARDDCQIGDSSRPRRRRSRTGMRSPVPGTSSCRPRSRTRKRGVRGADGRLPACGDRAGRQ